MTFFVAIVRTKTVKRSYDHSEGCFIDDGQKNGQGWQGVVDDSNQNGLLDRSDELIAQIPADLGLRDSALDKAIRNADFV